MGRIRIVNNGSTTQPVIGVDQNPHHEYAGDHIAWENDFGAPVYLQFLLGDQPLTDPDGNTTGAFSLAKGKLSAKYTIDSTAPDCYYEVSNVPFDLVRSNSKAARARVARTGFTSSAADVILD